MVREVRTNPMKRKLILLSKVARKKVGKRRMQKRFLSRRYRMKVRHHRKMKRKRNLRRRVERLASIDYSLILKRNSQALSVIITLLSGDELNQDLLLNVKALQPREIIVVQTGPPEGNIHERMEQDVRFIFYPYSENIYVGRGIGADYATGEVLLFLDNQYAYATHGLLPFVIECYGKNDIILTNSNPVYARKERFDSVNVAKSFLNHTLKLPYLQFSSLTDTPHAMKKKTAERIGYENLVIPPKAMVIAVINGLTINQINRARPLPSARPTPVSFKLRQLRAKETLLGDHMEAFQYLQSVIGDRAYYTDQMRRRDLLAQIKNKRSNHES